MRTITSVFIEFHWDLDIVCFSFQAAFQYVPLMQLRWRQSEIHSLAFRKLGALLYLFTTETCDISLVCLKLHNTVSIASKAQKEFCVTEIWLRWTAAMWWSNGSNSVCSSFNVASASLGNKRGSNEATVRLLEWFGSQLHERDTNFIDNSERGFPAVIISEPLLMSRMETQLRFNLVKSSADQVKHTGTSNNTDAFASFVNEYERAQEISQVYFQFFFVCVFLKASYTFSWKVSCYFEYCCKTWFSRITIYD